MSLEKPEMVDLILLLRYRLVRVLYAIYDSQLSLAWPAVPHLFILEFCNGMAFLLGKSGPQNTFIAESSLKQSPMISWF